MKARSPEKALQRGRQLILNKEVVTRTALPACCEESLQAGSSEEALQGGQ